MIFAGTGQRKPMGMAEVKLTLEMPDPALPGAVREVVVSRRLYRDTGSDYRINGRECRLKDVQDLLMDTGMGTRAYSFIQQGQIDLILSSKPKDRRSLLEEAAGITRYKLRRTDAERRLEDTRANLLRLDDILFELGKQQDSLKRQAAKARRAQDLDAAIQATQRILLAGKALELEAAKEAILENLDALERRIAALTAQASEKASEVENLHLALDELTHQQDRRARAILGLDQRCGLLEQDRGFQGERIQDARRQRRPAGAAPGGAGGPQPGTPRPSWTRLQDGPGRGRDGPGGPGGPGGRGRGGRGPGRGRPAPRGGRAEGAAGRGGPRPRRRPWPPSAGARPCTRRSPSAPGRLDALNHEEAMRAPRLESLQADQMRLGREEEGAADRLEQMEEAVQVQSRIRQETAEAHRTAAAALREAEGALEAEERRLRQIADLLREAGGSEDAASRPWPGCGSGARRPWPWPRS